MEHDYAWSDLGAYREGQQNKPERTLTRSAQLFTHRLARQRSRHATLERRDDGLLMFRRRTRPGRDERAASTARSTLLLLDNDWDCM